MFITFYSFKGGVGRSMALANTAEIFSRQQLRVLMVDFDLEAPGLERYFEGAGAALEPDQMQERRGIIDLLESYQELRSLAGVQTGSPSTPFSVEPLSNFVVPVYPASPERQSVALIPAGMRGANRVADYARRVRVFDWDNFYARQDGERFFEWFRKEAEQISDVVLVDSRTGLSEMSGVCTYQLADSVAMFVAPNQQNLAGVSIMTEALADRRLIQDVRKGRPLTMLCVPSRVEQSEALLLDDFARRFNRLFEKVSPGGLTFDKDAFTDLKIPYVPYYSYMERVAIREPARASASDLTRAYERIALALAQAAPEIPGSSVFKKLASTRASVVTTAPGADTAAARSSQTRTPPKQTGDEYDVFISYSRQDAGWAMKLSESLSASGLRVFVDSARMVAGGSWEPSLRQQLQASRNLLTVQSNAASTSDWVQRDVTLFHMLAGEDRHRRLIIVNLEGQSPLLAPFQGINTLRDTGAYAAGPDRVDAALWAKVIEAINQSIGGVTSIPLAILAMTGPDTELLQLLGNVRSFGVPLVQLLSDLGLNHADVRILYGPRPGDWHPFGSDQSIERLLTGVIANINATRGDRGGMRFRWAPVDPSGWTDSDSTKREVAHFMSAATSVLVLDPLSLYHPSVFQVLAMLSDCFYNKRSMIVVPSPVPPPPGTRTLMRAVEERGRPFFDPVLCAAGDRSGVCDGRGKREYTPRSGTPDATGRRDRGRAGKGCDPGSTLTRGHLAMRRNLASREHTVRKEGNLDVTAGTASYSSSFNPFCFDTGACGLADACSHSNSRRRTPETDHPWSLRVLDNQRRPDFSQRRHRHKRRGAGRGRPGFGSDRKSGTGIDFERHQTACSLPRLVVLP